MSLYHANADLILDRTLETMELLLGEQLDELLPEDKFDVIPFSKDE